MVALTQAERSYFVVLPNHRFSRKTYNVQAYKNGIYKIGFNWAPLLRKLGTTISSSEWASTSTGSANVTLSSTANTTLTTSLLVTVTASSGMDILKNTITMADGQKEIRLIRVLIEDPDLSYEPDYVF